MNKIAIEIKSDEIFLELQGKLTSLPHIHKEIELIYVKDGSCVAVCDNKRHSISKGDIFIAFPSQVHYYDNCQKGKYYVAIFNPRKIYEMETFLHEIISDLPVIKNYDKSELIFNLFETKSNYIKTSNVGYLNIIMGDVLNKITLKHRENFNNSTLEKIISYCNQHFAEDIDLNSIAIELNLNKYHVSHIINQKLGINFNTYLKTLRVKEACRLLSNTNKKNSDIAGEIGFGTIRSFNRAFLEIMNTTPTEYRKNPIARQTMFYA